MNYLSLENITKTYGEKVLFDNLSLQVTKGQKIALIAKNGSGKSTLLRVVGGMEGVEGENAKVWMNKSIRSAFLEQETRSDRFSQTGYCSRPASARSSPAGCCGRGGCGPR